MTQPVDTPASDEVGAHAWRAAQASRLLRFCRQRGLDAEKVMSGELNPDLASICDEHGKIQPERIDFR